jgi:hypothetical protein
MGKAEGVEQVSSWREKRGGGVVSWREEGCGELERGGVW